MAAAFWILAALVVLGAFWVVTLGNLFRAALSLGIVLLGVAGLFILLEAEFLAFAQILVYVGAILTLVVFAIMLTARLQAASPAAPASRQAVPAALVALSLFALLAAVTWRIDWPALESWRAALSPGLAIPSAARAVPLAELGQQLVTTLVLPFEVVSLVFIVALIGAFGIADPWTGRRPAGD